MPSSRPAASNGSNRFGGMPSTGRPRSLPRSNENSWSSFDTCASCWSSSWPGPTEVPDPNVFRDAAFPPPRRRSDVWCGAALRSRHLRPTQVQQDLLPEIVDTQVTVPMVNALEGVSGLDTVHSTSSQGVSLVIVLFKDV